MLAAARELSRGRGWTNVRLLNGDASDLGPELAGFDRVLAVLALSAFADPSAALRACHLALRPGGTLAVCDARPFQGKLRALNSVVVPVYRKWADWHPERDLLADISGVFGDVRTRSMLGGAFFVATATKR